MAQGNTSTENYTGNRTYLEENKGAFDGGDPILVELGSLPNTIIPLSGTVANRFGVFVSKLQAGDGNNQQCDVRLLNAGGTVRVKTSGAITTGQFVIAASGGTVTGAAGAAVEQIGSYHGEDAASGAVIEVVIGAFAALT